MWEGRGEIQELRSVQNLEMHAAILSSSMNSGEIHGFGHVILPTSPLPGLCDKLGFPVACATGFTTSLLRS